MLPFFTVALALPALPRLFARIGVTRAHRFGLVLQTLAMLGYALFDGYGAWCAAQLLGGIGAAAVWNGSEAMIAFNAPPYLRGRITGLYQSALGAALALGPFVPGLLALADPALGGHVLLHAAPGLYVVALALVAGAVLDALPVSTPEAREDTLLDALRAQPALAALAFAGGVFEAGLSSIAAAHGAERGLALAAATSIAGALGVGSFLLQYPAGWLADHLPLRRVFLLAGALLLAASLAFGFSDHWLPLLWAVAFVWGAVGGALYTLTMVRTAQAFAHSSAMAGTAAMIAGYTLGGAFGPLASGLALDWRGATGLAG
jgi:MFS family permease